MRTLAYRLIVSGARPYLLILHTAEPPAKEEWDELVCFMRDVVASATQLLPAIILTDGGSPDAKQRRALADVYSAGNYGVVTHVFTTSTFVRSVVNAFRWLTWALAAAHRPSEFATVCEACNLPAYAVFADLLALQLSLPKVQILREVERGMAGSTYHSQL